MAEKVVTMDAPRQAVALAAGALLVAALLAPVGPARAQACPATEATSASAVIASGDLPPAKRTRAGFYLTAADAYPMLAAQPERVLFLDVRTRAEVAFVGMPQQVDANVPFMLLPDAAEWDATRNAFRMTPNPGFVAEVGRRLAAKGLSKDDPVVLLCQAGIRAARAADELTAAGYTLVFSIVDGFEGDVATDGPTKGQRTVNGWKNAGLPWSYALAREKMYLPN